jgi:hypothetical protein
MEKLINQLIKKIDNLESLIHSEQKIAMSIVEYAKHSGVGENTLREWCASETLNFPCFKIGTKTIIHVQGADEFIKNLSEAHANL